MAGTKSNKKQQHQHQAASASAAAAAAAAPKKQQNNKKVEEDDEETSMPTFVETNGDVFPAEMRSHMSNSPDGRARLALLAAVEQAAKERKQTLTGVTISVALLSALSDSQPADVIGNILYLMAISLRHVSPAILTSKRQVFLSTLAPLLLTHSHEQRVIKSGIDCLSVILSFQDASSFVASPTPAAPAAADNSKTKKKGKGGDVAAAAAATPEGNDVLTSFHFLLSLSLDSRPKVRRAAQVAIFHLLKGNENNNNESDAKRRHIINCLDPIITAYVSEQLEKRGTDGEGGGIAHLASLMKMIFPYLTRKTSFKLAADFVEYATSSDNIVKMNVFAALFSFFSSLSPFSPTYHLFASKSQGLTKKIGPLIEKVKELKPSKLAQIEIMTAFVRCVGEACSALVYSKYSPSSSSSSNNNNNTTINNGDDDDVMGMMMGGGGGGGMDRAGMLVSMSLSDLCEYFLIGTPEEVQQTTEDAVAKILYSLSDSPPDFAGDDDKWREMHHELMEMVAPSVLAGIQSGARLGLIHSIRLVGVLFTIFGEHIHPFLHEAIVRVADLRSTLSSPLEISAIDACLACAMEYGGGLDRFLQVLPFERENGGKNGQQLTELQRGWLLIVLRDNMPNACHIRTFLSYLLPLANRLEQSSEQLSSSLPVAAKNAGIISRQIWDLLPAICAKGGDVGATIGELAQILAKLLRSDVTRANPICNSLLALCRRTKRAPRRDNDEQNDENNNEMEDGEEEEEEESEEDVQERMAIKNAVGSVAQTLLPAIFDAAGATEGPDRALLLSSAQAVACAAPPPLVSSIAHFILKKILTDVGGGRALCFDLLMTLIESVDAATLDVLLRSVKTFLASDDVLAQKKSYKILKHVANHHPHLILQNAEVIVSNLGGCVGPARKNRTHCLLALVENAPVNHSQFAPFLRTVMAELILGCRDANKKTRQAALQAILTAVDRTIDAGQPVTQVIDTIIAGLAGSANFMISCSLHALSCLIHHFRSNIVQFYPQLIGGGILLLKHPAREIVTAALGFIKVCVGALSREELIDHLPPLIPSLLLHSADPKNRFRMKVRVIFERLVRKFSAEMILPMVPYEHQALIHHIQKEQAKKKKAKNNNNNEDEDMAGNDGDEDDADSDDEILAIKPSKKKAEKVRFAEKAEDDDDARYDLTQAAAHQKITGKRKGREESDEEDDENEDEEEDEIVTDDAGRTVIIDRSEQSNKRRRALVSHAETVLKEEGLLSKAANEMRGKNVFGGGGDDEEEEKDAPAHRRWGEGTFKRAMSHKNRREQRGVIGGVEFKPKRSGVGGDVKKAGRPDPFAYVALDPKALSHRYRAKIARRHKDLFESNKQTKELHKKQGKK